MSNTRYLVRSRNLTFASTWIHLRFLVGFMLFIFFIFCCVFCFACLRPVSFVPSVSGVFCAQCFLCLLCPVFPVSFVPSVSGVFGLSPGTSLVNIYCGKNYIALVQLEIRYHPLHRYNTSMVMVCFKFCCFQSIVWPVPGQLVSNVIINTTLARPEVQTLPVSHTIVSV